MPRLLRRKRLIFVITIVCLTVLLLQQNIIKKGHSVPKWDTKQRNSEANLATLHLLNNKDQRFVVYNRVPKCGSMSMTTLCYRLGGANKFKVASPYEEGERPSKSNIEESGFVNFMQQQSPGYLYIRHQYFIDFTEFDEKQPIYINMIRDPIARFESFYYFTRFGNQLGGGASAKMSDVRRQETIDECVQKRRQECLKPYWQVVPYFCGQHPGCMTRSKWALDKAMENIDRHYVFVGTIEELETSLKILESILPNFFRNANDLYHNPENERMRHETSTRQKQQTSEATKDFLRSETSLKLEYKLYDFVSRKISNMKSLLLG